MKSLEFNIDIDAPADRVWFALWDDMQYRKWTSVFSEGSYAVSDWKEGSRVHFLSPSGDGMYSKISALVPNKVMNFTHLGEMKNFEEMQGFDKMLADDNSESWSGATENYLLEENDGKTTLTVKMDIVENFADYFNGVFPKALEIVKESAENLNIIIETTVNAPVDKVWQYWTGPEHIVKWNAASDDWHTTKAENDPRTGGRFVSRMEAKDGSFGFDFGGVYDEVIDNKLISYTMGEKPEEKRKVRVEFSEKDNQTKITESFEPEYSNSLEMQKNGWQAILNNFKKYTESQS